MLFIDFYSIASQIKKIRIRLSLIAVIRKFSRVFREFIFSSNNCKLNLVSRANFEPQVLKKNQYKRQLMGLL